MKTQSHFLEPLPLNHKSVSLGDCPISGPHFFSEKSIFKTSYRDVIFTPKEKAKSQSILLKSQLVELVSSLDSQSDRFLRAKLAYKTLETYVISSKFYQKELITCINELFPSIFCDKKHLKPELISWIYDKYDLLAAESNNLVPYFYITEYLYHAQTLIKEENSSLQQKIKDLKKSLHEKNQETDTLRHDYIRALQKPDGSEAKTQLKIAMAKIISTRENYEKKIKDLTESLNDVNNQLQVKEEEIKKRNEVILRKTQEFKYLTEDYEDMKLRREELVNENKKLSTYVKALIAKVKAINKENLRVQESLRDAEKEISELFVRASGGYTSLTPRPDYTKATDLLKLSNVESSTRARFDYLLDFFVNSKKNKRKGTFKHTTKVLSPR